MGTSTSSKGTNGQSPLVPSWANEDNQPLPSIDRNLTGFRGVRYSPMSRPNNHKIKIELG